MRVTRRAVIAGVAAVSCVLVVLATSTAATRRVVLVISPRAVLIDEPVEIHASGLRARQRVTLDLRTTDRVGVPWRSRTVLVADAKGVLDTRRLMRAFWSMKPIGRPAATTPFALSTSASPVLVSLTDAGRVLASGRLDRYAEADGLRTTETTLANEGFVGSYYSLLADHAAPGVIALDGSGGGHSELPWALIASHGYPTLSLAFFNEDGLPPTLKNIPMEYFARALRWLGSQPGVDPKRLAVVGISRGGEAALLVAASFPDLVQGVVACTSGAQVLPASDGVGYAWTLNGKPIPLGPIPVEQIKAATWVTGGGKDETFDSAQGMRDLLARARSHHMTNMNGAIYPNAGHAIGCVIPNQPLPQEFPLGQGGGYFERGGTSAGNEAAAASSWPHIKQLLDSLR